MERMVCTKNLWPYSIPVNKKASSAIWLALKTALLKQRIQLRQSTLTFIAFTRIAPTANQK
jgi:hypothetical protein